MPTHDPLLVQLSAVQKLWSEEAAVRLSGLLRSVVHVIPIACRPLSLSRARARLADVSAAFEFLLVAGGWQGRGIADMDIPLAFAVVDRLLGGPGSRGSQQRSLTDIERQVLQRVFSEAGKLLQGVLARLTPLQVMWLKERPVPLADRVEVDQPGLEWVFNVRFVDLSGGLRLLLPDPWQWIRRPGEGERGSQESKSPRPGLPKEGFRAQWVAVDAELGSAYLSARELQELSSGDIVCLPANGKRVLVRLDGRPAFWAQPCVVGGRMAVRLVSRCPEEEDAS